MKNFFLCPLLEEQKPINVYLKIKESPLFIWTTFSEKAYQQRILLFILINFVLIFLIRFPVLKSFSYFGEWILTNSLLNFISLAIFLIFLLIRWKEVQNQFQSPYIFYEETSWSDGEIWKKPISIRCQDQLLNQQRITPVIKRLTKTIFQINIVAVICFLLLKII